jgi:hypothetical protein
MPKTLWGMMLSWLREILSVFAAAVFLIMRGALCAGVLGVSISITFEWLDFRCLVQLE